MYVSSQPTKVPMILAGFIGASVLIEQLQQKNHPRILS